MDNTIAAFSRGHVIQLGFTTSQIIISNIRIIAVLGICAALADGNDLVIATFVDSNVVGQIIAQKDIISLSVDDLTDLVEVVGYCSITA